MLWKWKLIKIKDMSTKSFKSHCFEKVPGPGQELNPSRATHLAFTILDESIFLKNRFGVWTLLSSRDVWLVFLSLCSFLYTFWNYGSHHFCSWSIQLNIQGLFGKGYNLMIIRWSVFYKPTEKIELMVNGVGFHESKLCIKIIFKWTWVALKPQVEQMKFIKLRGIHINSFPGKLLLI